MALTRSSLLSNILRLSAFLVLCVCRTVSAAVASFFEDHHMDQRAMRKQGSSRAASDTDRLFYGQQQNLVHTFGTGESCARNCPRQCVTQELEDLAMMQRWICPSKTVNEDGANLLTDQRNADTALSFGQSSSFDPFPFSSQFLLIIVPLGLLTLILVLIISCRKCSKNSI